MNTLKHIFTFLIYATIGYFLFVLTIPDMSVWVEMKKILSLLFIDIPSGMFNFFSGYNTYFNNLSHENEWYLLPSAISVFLAFFIPVMYYVFYPMILLIFLSVKFNFNINFNTPFWRNEMYWLLGLVTTKEIINAEVQANAVANALNINNGDDNHRSKEIIENDLIADALIKYYNDEELNPEEDRLISKTL